MTKSPIQTNRCRIHIILGRRDDASLDVGGLLGERSEIRLPGAYLARVPLNQVGFLAKLLMKSTR